jgi:hypothetical protein
VQRTRPTWQSSALCGVLVSAGCVGGSSYPRVSPAEWLDAGEVVAVEGVPSSGGAPHRVLVRAVNRFGASVPAAAEGERAVQVDQGTSGDYVVLAFDGFGYASITFEVVGAATVSGLDGDLPIEVHTFEPGWQAPALQVAWSAPFDRPSMAVAGSTGGLVALGSEVWWVGEGAAPHRVLEADKEVIGLRSVNIDVDGVEDAIGWDRDTVYLLRGRSNGGMAWGGALSAPGREVAGADVGDVSGDNLPDLAIAWIDEAGEGLLDILEGDGLFRFVPAEPRTIPGRPQSLAVADNTGEGVSQVTVLQSEGDWSRFVYGAAGADGAGRYMPVGPRAPVNTMTLPSDGLLLAAGDLNGDDAAEITIAAPRYEGQGRDMWFVDVQTDVLACAEGVEGAQCGTQFLSLQQEPGAYVSVFDANGDYRADVMLQHDDRPEGEGVLVGVTYVPESQDDEYDKIRLLELPAYGPMGLSDFDGDGYGDLFLAAGPTWWRWLGRGFGDLERFWEPVPTPTALVRELVDGPFVLVEVDGDPQTVEVVAGAIEGGTTRARMFRYTVGGGRAELVDEVEVGSGGGVDDMAACGADVYLVADGVVSRLLIGAGSVGIAADAPAPGASRVACGQGPGGAQVATLESSGVQLRSRALGPVQGAVQAPGAVDVAIGRVGGEARIATCELAISSEGTCSVVHWPIGADGVFALGDAEGVLIDDGVRQQGVGGAGLLSVVDVDGDGRPDLLGLEPGTGLVSVFRSDGDGVPHPDLFHTELELVSPLAVADGDGDGVPDLWSIDAEGDVRYVPSAPETPSP